MVCSFCFFVIRMRGYFKFFKKKAGSFSMSYVTMLHDFLIYNKKKVILFKKMCVKMFVLSNQLIFTT